MFMTATRLEEVLGGYCSGETGASDMRERNFILHLDKIADAVCKKVGAKGLLDHALVTRNRIVTVRDGYPGICFVPSALQVFCDYLVDRSLILNIGSGYWCNAAFLAHRDLLQRRAMLDRIHSKGGNNSGIGREYRVSTKFFSVYNIESSQEMCDAAELYSIEYGYPYWPFTEDILGFGCATVEQLWADNIITERFDAIWSSGSFLCYTPEEHLPLGISALADRLTHGGYLGLTYMANNGHQSYNNLHMVNGGVEWCSLPDPNAIACTAALHGLWLVRTLFTDLPRTTTRKQNPCITQIFRKP